MIKGTHTTTMSHRRTFAAKRVVNVIVAGAAGTAFAGLLGWPVIDGVLIPFAFDHAIDKKRHEGRRYWWSINDDQIPDRKSLHEELLDGKPTTILLTGSKTDTNSLAEDVLCSSDSNGVLLDMSGAQDQRILLYATLTSLLDSTSSSFLSKLLLVYIKAINVLGNLLTGNQDINHTNFIFYSLFLDHLRTAVSRSYQKTGKPSLIIISNINMAKSPIPGTEDSRYLDLCVEELLLVAHHLVHKGEASVLLTSTSTSPEEARKWVGSQSCGRWLPSKDHKMINSLHNIEHIERLKNLSIIREVVGRPLHGDSLPTGRNFIPAERWDLFMNEPFTKLTSDNIF